MLRKALPFGIAAAFLLAGLVFPADGHAYWVWSPETGKWINPRKVPKDTPREQFDHAKSFFDNNDDKRAVEEFDKLINSYPQNRLAAEAQFYKGLAYERQGDAGKAAEAFKVLVDRYPYSERVNEAIRHEFDIADMMFGGKKTKFLGMEVVPAVDTAIFHYEHIVQTAPFGEYGVKAQYRIGEAHLALGNYDDAESAFQAILDDYPNSEYVTKAQYQIARTAYRSSLAHEYHQGDVDEALAKFERFKKTHPESILEFEANEAISELREKKAASLYDIAHFYQERRRFKSAQLYYEDVLRLFPDTRAADLAARRLEEVEIESQKSREGPLAFLSKPFTKEKEEGLDESGGKEGILGFLTRPLTALNPNREKTEVALPPPSAPAAPAEKVSEKKEGPLAVFSKPFSVIKKPFEMLGGPAEEEN